jgi:hypothetical protein
MKRYLQLALLPVVSMLLFGCPYQSKIPLSAPGEKIDRSLLGRWESEDEVYNSYTISPINQYEYRIVQRTTDGNIRNYTGFISSIRGATFLNAYSDSTKTYYLYRLKIDTAANQVKLMPFAKDLPDRFKDFPAKATDTQALNNFVWRSMNLRDFYDGEEQALYKRVNRNGYN